MIKNPHRGTGLTTLGADIPPPSIAADAVSALLAHCPAHAQTPLLCATSLADTLNVASVHIKDERSRMGLGSFKALGAAYVIACDAQASGAADMTTALAGQTYVTASAGNHGMSVAAGARVFGAQAVIYLSKTVPESFAQRLRDKGAQVVIEGDNYEASMAAAMHAAEANRWPLLSDSSWPHYTARPHRLMEGYLQMATEAFEQMAEPPSHIVLQAGVGGMAGAVAALARDRYGDSPTIIIVEPDAAPALHDSIMQGRATVTEGPVSEMGRLDCKEPSLIALKGLSTDADFFALITEEEGHASMALLAAHGLATTPSGGAGLSFLLAASTEVPNLDAASRVLAFLSEGPDA
ncbi:MAG: pyridoxal-phosphate dependent enzyme [Ahrensia sp.]